MSISDGLPVSIEAVLEGVNRGGIDDMLRKTVPRTDDPLTEEVFPGQCIVTSFRTKTLT